MTMDHTTTGGPVLLDALGRKRSPAATPGYGIGNVPKSKGRKYPPQALTTTEVQLLLAGCMPTSKHRGRHAILGGHRTMAHAVLLYRSGMRVQESLDLEERDLNFEQRQITIRNGKGGKRRVIGMDDWGWKVLHSWMEKRVDLPVGPVFPTILKGSEGRAWHQSDVRRALKKAAQRSDLRVRVAPHQLRHTWAVESWREGIDILTINRQLGHSRLDVTQAYLVSLGADDLLTPVTERKAPMVPMTV